MYSFTVTIFAGCKCLLKSGIWKVITTAKRICWIKLMESKRKSEEFNNITDTGTTPIFMACACEFGLQFHGTFFRSSCRVKFSKTFYYWWQRALFCLNKNLSFPKLAKKASSSKILSFVTAQKNLVDKPIKKIIISDTKL